jgi:hypothetical protein
MQENGEIFIFRVVAGGDFVSELLNPDPTRGIFLDLDPRFVESA